MLARFSWLLLFPLVACSGDPGSTVADATPQTVIGAWSLTTFGETGTPPAETDINVEFNDEGQLTGSSGCNRYFGSYSVGEAGALSTGALGATRMACPEPQMAEEIRYLNALQTTTRLRMDGNRLLALDESGTILLVFTRTS